MKEGKQKVLLFGLGCLGKELLKVLSTDWHVVAVDMDEDRINQYQVEISGEQYYSGAADSLVTWKKLDLDDVRYIISTIKDGDVNREACRIAREKFSLKIPIIIVSYDDLDEQIYKPFDVVLVNSLKPGIQFILKKLGKGVSQAVNLGLGKGELIEVEIKTRSHLVGRKLTKLKPSQWHVSAIYREDELIVPDGHSYLKVGDRVILVGHPGVLENVADILLKGIPQFPLQYGSDIVFPLHEDFSSFMDEAVYCLNNFKAQRIRFIPFRKKLSHTLSEKIESAVKHFHVGEPIELFKEIFMHPLDTGILVVPVDRGWLRNYRVRHTFKKSRKPFLLSRLAFPYEGIVILLNGPAPVRALDTGIEISSLLKIPYQVLYVALPKEMRGREEEEELRLCQKIVSDFEGIYKKSINYEVLEGNPVRQTLKYLKNLENHILVVVADPDASISFFKSNVPYLVAKSTRLSTLVIPETQTDE